MVRLDGGLATALQHVGLAPHTPVEPWLRTHPDRIVSAYRRFREAGSEAALTATFMALARPGDTGDTVARAVRCVRDADLTPWGCTGPVFDDPVQVTALARALVDNHVTRLVLETNVSGESAIRAVGAAREVTDLDTIVVSVVPTDAGTHTRDGIPLTLWARRAMDAGATGVGVNCVAPAIATTAVAHLAHAGPVWAKPAGCTDWADAVRPLAAVCTWLGGCCGVQAPQLEALWHER